MLARVSNIEAFRRWRESEDQTVADLVAWLTFDTPTPAMLAGTAFHTALETAEPGEYPSLESDGHMFVLADGYLAIPPIRELRAYRDYGPLTVTGKCDVLAGLRVEDHKTTARFDAERFLTGYQWRFYLDLFDAHVFRWNVFELREIGPKQFVTTGPHILETYRYPGLHDDCARLAADYHEFARIHLPGVSGLEKRAA